tara:strand:- start:910 stop:1077 length:168 start_codon:yes stop_codon:yes gene_type:complete
LKVATEKTKTTKENNNGIFANLCGVKSRNGKLNFAELNVVVKNQLCGIESWSGKL